MQPTGAANGACDGLTAVIRILQYISGINPPDIQCIDKDKNSDGKIGLEDAIYHLQIVSQLRTPIVIFNYVSMTHTGEFLPEEPNEIIFNTAIGLEQIKIKVKLCDDKGSPINNAGTLSYIYDSNNGKLTVNFATSENYVGYQTVKIQVNYDEQTTDNAATSDAFIILGFFVPDRTDTN